VSIALVAQIVDASVVVDKFDKPTLRPSPAVYEKPTIAAVVALPLV